MVDENLWGENDPRRRGGARGVARQTRDGRQLEDIEDLTTAGLTEDNLRRSEDDVRDMEESERADARSSTYKEHLHLHLLHSFPSKSSPLEFWTGLDWSGVTLQ